MPIRSSLGLVVLLGWMGFAVAQTDCPTVECASDLVCWGQRVDCLIRNQQSSQAIQLLKERVRSQADQTGYAKLLAKAYMAVGNVFWAIRTLQTALAYRPHDCDLRAWLAWTQLQQGFIDLALDELAYEGCPDSAVLKTRWNLLQALVAETKSDKSKQQQLFFKAHETGRAYPEDQKLLALMRRELYPHSLPSVSAYAEFTSGLTSNALAGSPLDLGRDGPTSVISKLDLQSTFRFFTRHWLSFEVAMGSRALMIWSDQAQEYSYFEPFVSPMLVVTRDWGRLVGGFRVETLLLPAQEGDNPNVWEPLSPDSEQVKDNEFYTAYRSEVEWSYGAWSVFSGVGRRLFSYPNQNRNRTEFDLGTGVFFDLGSNLSVLLAGSLRLHEAQVYAWDLWGATLLTMVRYSPAWDVRLQSGVTLGLQHYFGADSESGHTTFAYQGDQQRIDGSLLAYAQIESPNLLGWRLVLRYSYDLNDSSLVSTLFDFDYQQHRVLLTLRWAFDFYPDHLDWQAPAGHVRLDYGVDQPHQFQKNQQRIRDLLRQDEADRRSACGCGH